MKTILKSIFAGTALVAAFALSGCNHVPESATTTASIAGGDWVEYSSPKATDITIESAKVNPDGTVEINGLHIAAQPDEAVVNNTGTVDQAYAQLIGQQSAAFTQLGTAALGSLLGKAPPSSGSVSALGSPSTDSVSTSKPDSTNSD